MGAPASLLRVAAAHDSGHGVAQDCSLTCSPVLRRRADGVLNRCSHGGGIATGDGECHSAQEKSVLPDALPCTMLACKRTAKDTCEQERKVV